MPISTTHLSALDDRENLTLGRQRPHVGPRAALKPGRTPGTSTNPATDFSRIKAGVGYQPEHTVETGIAAYIDWLRSPGVVPGLYFGS